MFYYDSTYILLIPAIIFTVIAQAKVSNAYGRFAQVAAKKGITGRQAAEMIMKANSISIPIEVIGGKLSDHYDPSKQVLRLSSAVANDSSVASIAIAAHEVGHALQHAESYAPIAFRGALVPVANIASFLAWPLLILGIILPQAGMYYGGNLIFNIGIILFVAVVLFHAVTLPVEFNASSRAMKQIEGLGILYQDEMAGAKKVLSAAAMTYVAALAVAVINLIRILLIRGRE